MNNIKEEKESKEGVANELKEFFKKWPRFYYFVYDFLGPLYFGGMGPTAFLKKYHKEGICYNLGSGTRRIASDILNVDIAKYFGVDVVDDITNLSFGNEVATSVICDQVLEHVTEPEKAVSEIYRILQPGGYAYVSTPFMYPFHASPDDYQRWSHNGLRKLLSDFEVVELETRCGPFSMLTVYLCYFFATISSFGSEKLYWFLVLAFTFIFFPVKLLDIVGNRLPFSKNMAAVLYCVVRKK